jgi:hypothetical protein
MVEGTCPGLSLLQSTPPTDPCTSAKRRVIRASPLTIGPTEWHGFHATLQYPSISPAAGFGPRDAGRVTPKHSPMLSKPESLFPRPQPAVPQRKQWSIIMRDTLKATAALALLALGWTATAASPALAGPNNHGGVAAKAAAYQAEGLGTDTDGLGPNTDVEPAVTNHIHLGGVDLATQTDAGLARLLGVNGAKRPAPAAQAMASATGSGNFAAGETATGRNTVGGYPLISPLHSHHADQ